MTINTIIHKYNILCMNRFMENDKHFKYKKFYNIKTLNTICKNLYDWKQYDLLEQIFEIDQRTYLYLLKRLICLHNNKQFLYWFNKYNINWNEETAGLQYLLIQVLKYRNHKLFEYFLNNFNIKDYNHDYYIKTILHIPIDKWSKSIKYIIDNILTVDDIHFESVKKLSVETLFCIATFETDDTPEIRAIKLTYLIKEKERYNYLLNIFK